MSFLSWGAAGWRPDWRAAGAGLLALMVAMGVGRFAFTPLLPPMLDAGWVDLVGGGWLATANYAGYLVGAAICTVVRMRPGRMVRWMLVATALLTLLMALPQSLWLWLVWRTISGVVSAVALVCTTAWCLATLTRLGAPRLVALIYCGPGIGIALTGLAAAPLAHLGGASLGWAGFGVLALLLAAWLWPVFEDVLAPAAPAAADTPAVPARQRAPLTPVTVTLAIAYGLAGLGYIVTATFLPVIARLAMPDSMLAHAFWPLFGIAVALGAALASRVPVEANQRLWLAGGNLMQAVGILVGVWRPDALGLALSSFLIGLPFTTITLFAMREARRLTLPWGDAAAASLIGLLTLTYAAGQMIGPPLAVALAGDVPSVGAFDLPLELAALALMIGAVLSACGPGWRGRSAS